MTKKRFEIDDDDEYLTDNKTGKLYDACGGGDGFPFVISEYHKLQKENEKLKQSKKGQELEIVRLHHLADAMSGVLRELGIYDVYNKEQIEKAKKELQRND